MIQLINIKPNNANQTVSFSANNQQFTLNIYMRGYISGSDADMQFQSQYAPITFYCDIYLNNTLIFGGMPIINQQPINQYASNIVGYIAGIDLTNNDLQPTIDSLGVTYQLFYVDDLANISDILEGNY